MGDLIYPPYGYAAVVEGAVRHLQKPNTIYRRVSSLTYGVRSVGAWTHEMPESYKQLGSRQGAHITDKAFVPAIAKGCEIKVGTAGSAVLHTAVWHGCRRCCACGSNCCMSGGVSAAAWMRIFTQAGAQVELQVQAIVEGGEALVELYCSEDASPTHVTGRMQLVERIEMPLYADALDGSAPIMVDLTCRLAQDKMQVRFLPLLAGGAAAWCLLQGLAAPAGGWLSY
jgi:hypothetical protein